MSQRSVRPCHILLSMQMCADAVPERGIFSDRLVAGH